MIIVTGGAGFIGSAVVHALNERGRDDIIIVDHLGSSEKWKNCVALRYDDYLDKKEFINELEEGRFGEEIEVLFHFGACSSTTETDAGYLMENNFRYTARLGGWWERHSATRFIYASSAATYGGGEQGYMDDKTRLHLLRPLNMYGYSKHLFDMFALRKGWLDRIVGLKYFNVFGPNEYHKGDMRSVINKAFPRIRDEGVIALFKSYRPEYGNGEQLRDFIYVKDAVAMTLFFMDRSEVGGIFNIGTGRARSWNDSAHAMFLAVDKKTNIEYVEMPESLREKYQYFTQADLTRLREAGCMHECRTLESSVEEYVRNYLPCNGYLEPEVHHTMPG
ncbi:MAG: ADP-glyceromanno-heptose 6-epimerase [Chitinispirillaceae bacterium]|nr:ADP-glyceromanno-heptose 6-epimerase [Chitinispirillaceae bacterium]